MINFDSVEGPVFVPRLMGINSTTNHIYVAGNVVGSNVSTLLLIDGKINKILGDVRAGVEGDVSGIAVNHETNRIYVISQSSGDMGVIQD